MSEMRYEQYGPAMGYQQYMDKGQGTYQGRGVPPMRYGTPTMANSSQMRMPRYQGMRGNEMGRAMPKNDMGMPDRKGAMNQLDDEAAYNYMAQANRNMPQRSSGMYSDAMDPMGHPSQALNSRQGSFPSSARATPSEVDYHPDAFEAKIPPYKQIIDIFNFTNSVDSYNYVLPSTYIFPQPTITPAHIKSFSTDLLLYIFYCLPLTRHQLLAAAELYARDMVYHREKQTWFQRDKSTPLYAQANCPTVPCSRVFRCELCQFMPCEEVLKSSDIIPLSEINEYLKRAGWTVCEEQTMNKRSIK
ncbi:uncharacterized protein [Blastocystis hominis]|uniref:NOT2/NOT3/NOT5 C-terminal domain-containing protein n=1 Tax=Blastocystis hominis TaxID=12968 RepID=D8M2C7_BLAHO|nr:uncharacterized protein [Blastocystis hominis]CBK22222.2 unnamed protein product [Blastocystis hominis]|eukprot:XP_012896270.1 uncharacterized protein [Blastocystis hominis]